MRRRLPRRQGVVYGPLPPRDPRAESGGVLGRILGGIVVLGAVAVLTVVGFSFVAREGPPAPTSPSPTAIGQASPTPTARPTPRPTPTATQTASPEATPQPTPTPFPVEVREGPGHITFGSNYATNPGRIVEPSASFPPSGRFAWIAHIGGRAGTTQLVIEVHQIDPSDGSETLTYQEDYSFRDAGARRFLRRVKDIGALVDGPGLYVMRYVIDGETRAEGYFRVEQS
ncbi:MAG: hypothetical protein M3N29_08525 [Chloroflexota bacterium]|nr:hypothetical protein [Chloroflexota bacterium]